MPNWNSCTIPVTTPMAKLMRKSFPQNLVARRYSGRPVRTHVVCSTATRPDSPIVSGTKKKWYTVVIPNCQRAMTQEITEVDPPRTWAARGIDGPVRPNASVRVEPHGQTGSRVTFALDFQGRGIGRLLVPLVVRPMAAKGAPVSYRRLKERL